MGIRDWFKKKPDSPQEAAVVEEDEDAVSQYAQRMFDDDTWWAIEIFDPEWLDPINFAVMMIVEPPTLLGPYKDPLFASKLMDRTLNILNENIPATEPQFTGRLRALNS